MALSQIVILSLMCANKPFSHYDDALHAVGALLESLRVGT